MIHSVSGNVYLRHCAHVEIWFAQIYTVSLALEIVVGYNVGERPFYSLKELSSKYTAESTHG